MAGAFGALVVFLGRLARGELIDTLFAAMRSNLGRSILLGLEFLVAEDIINIVAVEPTLRSLAVLAGIISIRTFRSFSLEVEIEGRWPWQKMSREAGRTNKVAPKQRLRLHPPSTPAWVFRSQPAKFPLRHWLCAPG